MITRIVVAACLTASLVAPAGAQEVLKAPQLSPAASVSQSIGLTDVTVSYHRPAVAGRKVWGELVPYGEVWRTGANENATIRFSTPVKIGGKPLSAGTYGLFMIPGATSWTVVFSKLSVAWGAYSYDAKEDALRIRVTPQPTSEPTERLSFGFDDPTNSRATVALRWERLRVPFVIEVDTPAVVMASMRAELRGLPRFYWPGWAQAADYWLHNGGSLEEAQAMADRAIGLGENFITLSTGAAVAERRGDSKRAASLRDQAVRVGQEREINEYASALLDVKRTAEALAIFTLNAASHPQSSDAVAGMAEATLEGGDKKTAIVLYEKALKLARDERSRAYLEKTIAHLKTGAD
jgi:Protein of unknown function (DUF2911)